MSTDPDTILLEAEDLMSKAIDHLNHEFRGIRAGRASPGLVEMPASLWYPMVANVKPSSIRLAISEAPAVMPQGTPWLRQASSTVRMASTMTGSLPDSPYELERSLGPMKMAPTPPTLMISSMFSTPSRDSIWSTASSSPCGSSGQVSARVE